MKLLRWVEWSAFAVSALLILYVAYGVAVFLYVFGPDLVKSCDIAHGNSAENGRGDLVEDQVRDCAIIGSAAEDRIGLKLADAKDFVVYYDFRPKSHEPIFRWLGDDHLDVDLGEVTWLTPQIDRLGRIRITYSGAEPSLE
jgi:hypothetical protein